jgi:sugar/nucleoside kinase (ribokinase family)
VKVGVDVGHIQVVPDRFSLNVIVIIDRSGERFFFVHPENGPAARYFPPDALDLSVIAQAAWLHTSGSGFGSGTTREVVLIAMKSAKQGSVPISLDLNLRPETNDLPESYRETVQQAVGMADYVLGSSVDEIAYYTGIEDTVEAAQELAGGKRTVISRLGGRGCMVVSPYGEVGHVPGFKVQVVDTMGAGDIFDAGFITAKLEGLSPIEAARWGNALAALSVSHEGATDQLSQKAMERLLQSH